MNTKSSRKHKSARISKDKSKNEETEVFVIPPNLLQQLGIKLDNIVSTDNCPVETKQISDFHIENTVKNQQITCNNDSAKSDQVLDNKNESSILQTANLMRESVFLSPTFVANVIPGELEIASPCKINDENAIVDSKRLNKEDIILAHNSRNTLNATKNEVDIDLISMNNNNDSINDTVEDPYPLIDKSNKSQNIPLDNVTLNLNHDNINKADLKPIQNLHKDKQIQLINEEVIDVTKLYGHTYLKTKFNNNFLEPIPIDMVLPPVKRKANAVAQGTIINGTDNALKCLYAAATHSPKINSKHENTLEAGVCVKADISPFVVTDDVLKKNTNEHQCKAINSLTNGNDSNRNETIYKNQLNSDSSHVDDQVVSNENELSIKGNNDVNELDIEDTYKNIILDSQPLLDVNTRLLNLGHNKELLNIPMNRKKTIDVTDNTKLQAKNNSLSILTSCKEQLVNDASKSHSKPKLSVQGVEKPGGDKEETTRKQPNNFEDQNCICDVIKCQHADEVSNEIFQKKRVLKTYERKNKSTSNYIPDFNKSVRVDDSSDSIDLNSAIHLNVVGKADNFCLCGDFGQLQYYDDDSLYEHIHFWEHEEVISDVNIIFSIYNDENIPCYSDHIKTSFEVFNESPDEQIGKICWYDLYVDLNSDHSTVGISEQSDEVVQCQDLIPVATTNITLEQNEKNIAIDNVIEHEVVESDNSMDINLGFISETIGDKSCDKIEINMENALHHTTETLSPTQIEERRELFIPQITEEETFNEVPVVTSSDDDTSKIIKSKAKKRTDLLEETCTDKPLIKKNIQCGVCECTMEKVEWRRHSKIVHGHIAWKAGDKIDFNSSVLHTRIKQKLADDGALKCQFCDMQTKQWKRYLLHVEQCIKDKSPTQIEERRELIIPQITEEETFNEVPVVTSSDVDTSKIIKSKAKKRRRSDLLKESLSTDKPLTKKNIKCGVCERTMDKVEWRRHLKMVHGHIAWMAGEKIDFNSSVLHNRIKQKLADDGALKCQFCDMQTKQWKRYLLHVEQCIKDKFFKPDVPKSRTRKSDVSKRSSYDKGSSMVNCGVCQQDINASEWFLHICHYHMYIAWKSGEAPLSLDDEDNIEKHLLSIINSNGPLICSKCGLDRKYGRKAIKKFLSHIKTCDKATVMEVPTENVAAVTTEEDIAEVKIEAPESAPKDIDNTVIKCGVCGLDVTGGDWYDHIGKEHNYLAWKEGANPLNLEDKDEVWQHLYGITKEYEGLVCHKCGIKRKYVKKYLSHIKECNGQIINGYESVFNVSMCDTSYMDDVFDTSNMESGDIVVCGVCSKNIPNEYWVSHIQRTHNYIAWKSGEQPLNLHSKDEIEQHLRNVIKEHGYLTCPKCADNSANYGVDTVNLFLEHIEDCQKAKIKNRPSRTLDNTYVICGVCSQKVNSALWIEHIKSQHTYFAWKDGEDPPSLDDTESRRLFLMSMIDEVEAFECVKCNIKKKYPKSFITHIDSCESIVGGPVVTCAVCSKEMDSKLWRDHAMNDHYNLAWRVGEPPIDLKSSYATEKHLKEYKLRKGNFVCNICGITRVSMAGFHAHIITCGKTEEELEDYKNICELCNHKYLCIYKNQHMSFHREQEYIKARKLQQENAKAEAQDKEENVPSGRRKAAVKANDVIEKLKSMNKFKHSCIKCGFETDSDKKLARHKCNPVTFDDDSEESDESDQSEERSDITDVSAEEENEDAAKKKRYKESIVQAKVPKLPFKYKEANFVQQIKEDFYQVHYTSDTLYSQWHKSGYELMPEDQLCKYLPEIESSCQIKSNDQEWYTINRFEVKQSPKGFNIFVGGSIQCISWIPPHVDDHDDTNGNYLSISTHRGSDTPRINFDELQSHAGFIQLWSFENFDRVKPKLVMGIAHDFGTVWAMDWCPSGARDMLTGTENKEWLRLGLLAVACSNGFVYILSVPYPTTITNSVETYIKLNPVAELRISMRPDRKLYQATAISWTKEKGHGIIMVGYADGTTAFYDITGNSPLLHTVENGVDIFYPYRDEREYNVSVSGVNLTVGAACSASGAGATAALRPDATVARMFTHHHAKDATFAPSWPSVFFSVDDMIASQAHCELDWYGCGRRVGQARAWGACGRCGRALAFTPPALRALHALPPHVEPKRQNILELRVESLTNKRKRENDELSMLVEPLTFEKVVQQYGVHVMFAANNAKGNSSAIAKDPFTERFPLADVTSIKFCQSAMHHHKVAIALHSGLLFIITVK